MDKIEDDIEEDREGRSKDKVDGKSSIKTVPNCKDYENFWFCLHKPTCLPNTVVLIPILLWSMTFYVTPYMP